MSNKELKKSIRESKPLKQKGELYKDGDIFDPETRDSLKVSWEYASGSYEKGLDRSFGRKKQTEHNYSTSKRMGGSVERYEHIEGENYPNPADKNDLDIAQIHGISFIKEVIPKLIQKKIEESIEQNKPTEKVRILDVGGGVGIYAEQIRKIFGDDVEVITTGLRKKPVRQFRRLADEINRADPEIKDAMNWKTAGPILDGDISNKMHKKDLKKRSILEFKDFPEFDLIIETAGELAYQTDYNRQASLSTRKFLEDYLTAVVKKLKPGGIASISHIDFILDNHLYERDINDILNKFSAKYEIIDNNANGRLKYHKVLRIEKLESLDENKGEN